MTMRLLIERMIATLLLMMIAPLLLVIAGAIALTMGRPVFFSQVRSGLRRHPYRMWKFRTMTDMRDPAGRPLPDECRTTRLGAFMRRSRIDELPELWHIVRGEMSFIGPRPLLPPTIMVMGEDGVRRCSVRPGLTGWAQIHGGPLISLGEKLALDLWYIESASLRIDAFILWRTMLVVLLGDRLPHDPVPMPAKKAPPADVPSTDVQRSQSRIAPISEKDSILFDEEAHAEMLREYCAKHH